MVRIMDPICRIHEPLFQPRTAYYMEPLNRMHILHGGRIRWNPIPLNSAFSSKVKDVLKSSESASFGDTKSMYLELGSTPPACKPHSPALTASKFITGCDPPGPAQAEAGLAALSSVLNGQTCNGVSTPSTVTVNPFRWAEMLANVTHPEGGIFSEFAGVAPLHTKASGSPTAPTAAKPTGARQRTTRVGVQGEVAAMVGALIGHDVGLDEPLFSAG